MEQKLHEHYLQLWQLVESLRKNWWDNTEEARIKQLLKDAAVHDPNLSGLNPTDPDFFEDLSLKLSSLVISKPEIPSSNMPSPDSLKQWDAQKKEHLDELKKRKDDIPLVFLNQKGRLANIPQEETYLILKKHGLVDSEGNFNLNNTPSLIKAQEEIGLKIAYYHHLEQVKEAIVANFEDNRSPVTLFSKQTLGDDASGLVDAATRKIAENANSELLTIIGNNLSGQPISLATTGLIKVLDQAASSLKTTAITKGFISQPEAMRLAKTFLTTDSRFQLLESGNQQLALDRFTQAIVSAGANPHITPKQFYDIVIKKEGEGVLLKLTPVEAFAGPDKEYQIRSACTQTKTVGERIKTKIQKELNSADTYASTKQITSFIKDFCDDPIRAVLYYPVLGTLSLIPEPFKGNRYANFKKKWLGRYALTVNPDAQRKYVEDLFKKIGKGVIKETLKHAGLVTQNGQFTPLAALGWVGNKLVTGIGESLGGIFSHIPLIGKTLGNIFRRRLGKGRKKDERLITNILGTLLDLSIVTALVGPKISWWLINKIPGVKNLRISIAKKWINFRFGVETRFPFLKYARLSGGIAKALVRSLPRGLITTGIGWVATGNPAIAITGGSADFLFIFLKNLGKISEIANWAIGPHTTIPGRFFGWAMSSRWAYFPVRGPFVSWLIVDKILPGYFGINLPLWLKIVTTIGSGGLEYGIATGIRPLLPSFISRFITGPLGKFFGFLGKLINPGAFLGGSAAVLAGLNPLQIILAGAGSGLAYLGLLKLLFGFTSPFLLTGWLGYLGGGLLANVLGLTGWYALGLQIFTTALSLWLTHIGVQALASWVASSVSAGLNAALAGTSAAATGTTAAVATTVATVLLVITLVISFVYIVWITSSAFFEGAGLRKGLVSSYIPITKSYPAPEKDASGNIIALNYTITYGYKPTTDLPTGPLTDIQIRDFFEEPKHLGVHFQEFFSMRFELGNRGPFSTFTPCAPLRYDNMLLWYKADSLTGLPPEVSPSIRETCPEIGPVNPNETKTITMKLLLKKPLNQLLGPKETLCNRLGVSGEVPSKGRQTSSFTLICIDAEGKVVTTPAAELALKIIRELQKCGITNMDTTNIDEAQKCLVAANISQVAIDIMIQSMTVLKFPSVQCLSFIEAVEAATGGKLQTYGLGTAKLYWTSLLNYQQIDVGDYNNIAVGDILVWTTGVAGHVAIVTQSYYDSGKQLVKIEIAENLGTTTQGQMNIREIPVTGTGIDSPGLAGWQRRK